MSARPPRVGREVWDEVAAKESPSWYLDPLVAEQKRAVNLSLLRRWTQDAGKGTFLKTDLFEEANGSDEILSGCPGFDRLVGMDVSAGEVSRAWRRTAVSRALFLVTDVRQLALASESVDVVFSNSTLDHFETAAELDRSLQELIRVVRPGGTVIVTLDNARNPLYWLLRLVARRARSPFPLGVTTSLPGLVRKLEDGGLEITDTDHLIHNPRVVSTALFLALRKTLGSRADGAVRLLLRTFGLLGRLPTRGWTSCFVAARATKPAQAKFLGGHPSLGAGRQSPRDDAPPPEHRARSGSASSPRRVSGHSRGHPAGRSMLTSCAFAREVGSAGPTHGGR